ncbi:MAG: aldo/keto reductase, partial [Ilumatobacteraceae bacterium]
GLRWAGRDAAVTANARAALREIAAERSSTMTHVALSWLRRHDAVQPIVGARSPQEAGQLATPPLALSDDELARLGEAAARPDESARRG